MSSLCFLIFHPLSSMRYIFLVLLFLLPALQCSHSRSSKAACCRSTEGVIQDIHSRIVNPSYPEPDSVSTSHVHRIEIQENMCGLRLNFEKFKLSGLAMGSSSCGLDTFTVLVPGYSTQPTCGVLTGYTMNYPVREADRVHIIMVVQSRSHYWNIIASQIPCAAVESNPLTRGLSICGRRPRYGEFNLESPLSDDDMPIVNDPSIFQCPSGSTYLRCYLDGLMKQKNKKWEHKDRIVNGRPARRFSWPWQVAFLIKGKFLLCGGALISPDVAITAGHCLSFIQRSMNMSDLVIGAGVHRLDLPNVGVVYRKCKTIILHPNYADIHQDISLCILETPFPISERIGPVCLPFDTEQNYVGEEGHITGWGRTSDNSDHASVLQEASIPIVENSECAKAWAGEAGPEFGDVIEDSMICGGGNNKSTCNGDSGGPLTVLDKASDRHILVGLTSFGPSDHCNVPGKPLSVFARVSSHMDFISLAAAEITVKTEDLKTYTPC